jgi:hypothetical protein
VVGCRYTKHSDPVKHLLFNFNDNPRPFGVNESLGIQQGSIGGAFLHWNTVSHSLSSPSTFSRLLSDGQQSQNNRPGCYALGPSKESVPTWRVPLGVFSVFIGLIVMRFRGDSRRGWLSALLCGLGGGALVLNGYVGCESENHSKYRQVFPHNRKSVTQKCLTTLDYCNTVMVMANVLSKDKQIAVIGALAEGSSIRSIERITGIHRDTIMRLGVRVGP